MATIAPNVGVFGATGGALNDVTIQSRSVSTKMEKKTATGSNGEIIAVAFYGAIAEHKLELLNAGALKSLALIATSTKPGIIENELTTTTRAYIIEEVSVDLTNDDFAKGSVTISEVAIED